ncbi:hypothetical protein HYH02_006337 [Chlamydomonas schloesseri]|uniref:HIT-type domain-containing protein n=1 Tax=Chlamydomonas schloesseri TaxID=2026947 RepID=A0A836B5W1_9CHLO|nr:hypothetical protein HYH02_006337 [Chlamydomonas schloesseri]|eukprot:KAG2448445.1 hypothetical protein HYH02_006337 [Chlamydomonas schloesseri]
MAPKANAQPRRALRERKVSQRMAVVDETTRLQAAQARLDALENDNDAGGEAFGMASDDEEFNLEDEEEEEEVGGKKKKGKKAGGKRKLRGAGDRRGPKNFARLLDDAELDRLPASKASYLTTAVRPSTTSAMRKFCSVCGNVSGYTCARCGSKYCCRKCYTVHTETRCLKFTV